MLESAQSDLLFGDQYQLEDDDNPLPLGYGQIPIAYNVFELPSCARCLFGYSCNSHKLDQKWIKFWFIYLIYKSSIFTTFIYEGYFNNQQIE